MLVSIVIPCYNEEGNIEALYYEIQQIFHKIEHDYETVFVDDGSTDNTFNKIKELIDKGEENIRLVQLRGNFKKSAAMTAGFQNAKGDIIITMDGDGQDDPNDIPQFLDALIGDDQDVVCGWRKKRKDGFFIKKIPSKIYNLLNRIVFRLKIHDSDCNYRAYRKEAVQDLVLLRGSHRYVPAILKNQGYRLTEVKINHRPRVAGKSKYGLKRILQGTIDLVTFRLLFSFGERPLRLFFNLGLLCLITAFGLGVYLLVLKYTYNQLIGNRPLLLFVAVLGLSGFQVMFFGLLGELIVRHNREPSSLYNIKRIYDSTSKKE